MTIILEKQHSCYCHLVRDKCTYCVFEQEASQ